MNCFVNCIPPSALDKAVRDDDADVDIPLDDTTAE